jgi:hypothetical protein
MKANHMLLTSEQSQVQSERRSSEVSRRSEPSAGAEGLSPPPQLPPSGGQPGQQQQQQQHGRPDGGHSLMMQFVMASRLSIVMRISAC